MHTNLVRLLQGTTKCVADTTYMCRCVLPCTGPRRYSAGSSKQRASTASPGVAGAAAAAAAPAAAAGLPGTAAWQQQMGAGARGVEQQRDQGARPGRGTAQGGAASGTVAGANFYDLQQQQQQQGHGLQGLQGFNPGSLSHTTEQQQEQQGGAVAQTGCVEKSGSPVLDDLLDPAGAANLQQLQQHGDIWSLLQGIASHQQQQPQQQEQAGLFDGSSAAPCAGSGPPGVPGPGESGPGGPHVPQHPQQQQQQQRQMPSGAGSAAVPRGAPAAAGSTPEAAAAAATVAGHGMPGVLSLGDVVPLPNDFWHELMIDLAQDPVTDAHLHPGQVGTPGD